MGERRHDCRRSVDFILNAYQDGVPGLASADNISVSGIRVRRLLEPRRHPGRRIDLEFQLPNDPEVLFIRGERVYQRRDGIGIRFVSLTPSQREKLAAFVH